MRIALLLLVAFVLMGVARPVEAADPPRPEQPQVDQFDCCVQWNLNQQKLLATGVWRWSFAGINGCPDGLRKDVIEVLDEISQLFGILMLHDPINGSPMYENCGVGFASVCSGVGVAACLGRGYPTNTAIDFKSDIETYYPESRKAIIRHELLHAMLTWNEQYCPAFRCGIITCLPGWRDFMNCGMDSRHGFEDIELDRYERTAGVVRPDWGRGNNGGDFLYWCNTGKTATKVALLALNVATGEYRFTGTFAPPSPSGCVGWHVVNWQLRPGEVPCFNVENGVNTRYGRNDTCA